jgi:hypothetical protein
MGIFKRQPINETNQNPISKPVEPEPEEDEETICVNCEHHTEKEGDLDYEHNCFAQASEEINYVTGEKHWIDIEDCEEKNSDGDCGDYEKKV